MKRLLLKALGLALCVVPPAAAILAYFPLWLEAGGGRAVSGTVLLLLTLALVPLWKTVRRLLRSPASYVLWLIAFLLFFLVGRVADEMSVISFAGLIGNLAGAAVFRLADRGRMKDEDRV